MPSRLPTPARQFRTSWRKRTFIDVNRRLCPVELFAKDGDDYRPINDAMLVEYARRVLQAHFTPGSAVMRNTHLLHQFLAFEVGMREHETFGLVLLDKHDCLIDYVEICQGSQSTCAAPSRD